MIVLNLHFSSDTDDREHLESISLVLLALRDDIKKMSVDIAEVRVELRAVNTALGIAIIRSILIYKSSGGNDAHSTYILFFMVT
jgi:hypothetical protein